MGKNKSPNEWRDDWANLSDEDKANIYEDRRIYSHYENNNTFEEKVEEFQIKKFYDSIDDEPFDGQGDIVFNNIVQSSFNKEPDVESSEDGTDEFDPIYDDEFTEGEDDED